LLNLYRDLEVTFLIDKKEHTFETMMGLLFGAKNVSKMGGLLVVSNFGPQFRMRLLHDKRVLYSGPWPGAPKSTFNLIWKPRGGGKRDSQLQFISLLQYGVISKPRDAVLFVDADTSFDHKVLSSYLFKFCGS
jgi:hypothetical protein